MVKPILMIFLFLFPFARADVFDFVSPKSDSKLISLTKKLRNLQIKEGPEFEENFNGIVKNIEMAMEEEKLYCSSDAPNNLGKILPPAQKQFCMRELKKQYLESMSTIFEIKRKYLSLLHKLQLNKLTETQKRLHNEIERNF